MTREPYWAVAYRPENYYPSIEHHVSIKYLLSYHTDYGSFGTGHEGDSEFIIVDVRYNETSQHWELWQVFLSAHWASISDQSSYVGFGSLEFPHHYRGYPLIYVSKNKHANFPSKRRCDDSLTDSCPNMINESSRVDVRENRNIGSNNTRLLNTVASANPNLYPGQESFWTANNFCGWWLGATDCAGGYKRSLNAFNF